MDDLQERVVKYNTLKLPGQPIGIHMGTSYLINDLWREVQRLRKELAQDVIYPEEDRDEQSRCDKCGKVMSFSDGTIFYIETEPKLLCWDCAVNHEIQRTKGR